ncbi:hypothetical protein GDO86_009431 [Hymenochirus boettgeri]|uniref:Zinc finger MYM-type protein 1 n=1 Tax=Hymenochirus boettgeri TaxID=247094 RepID=A0A8T2JIX7_9PIPI|nr:hypothetical protein GDO86_009431 [Hymenochirus boettgeri]
MYPHKSGFQKRKKRKEREQEEERLKKKQSIFKYFPPKSTQQAAETSTSPEADLQATPTINEEMPSCCASTDETLIICEETPSSGKISTAASEMIEDVPLCVSEDIVSVPEEPCYSSDTIEIDTSTVPSESLSSENLDWKDPAFWPETLKDTDRKVIVCSGLKTEEELKEMAPSMPKVAEGRPFSEFLLYAKSSNGREKILRDWLSWSNSKQRLYCITCLAFSTDYSSKGVSFLCRKEGFEPAKNKWHRLYMRLPEHEQSSQHRKHYWSWRTLQKSIGGQGIDAEVKRNLARQADKFTLLLQRLLDVTLYLASRNLAFRGSTQKIGDLKNGNFLGTLELLSQYDTLLHDHLSKVKASQEKGKKLPAHYLSWATQNEFIDICGNHILDAILSERKEAIYFSIICDATPDISHTEQNVIIIRYVHRDSSKRTWNIEEGFIEFFDFFKKTGEEIAEMIMSRLSKFGLDLCDCRGQGYDNGANMSGRIKGVQARIQEKYPEAIYCPCAAHTLNLVGVHAAACCPEMKSFFGNTLTKEVGSSLHGLSETRWSARIEAVRPFARRLPSILTALEKVIASGKLTTAAHSDAQGLYEYFSSFRALFLTTFWVKILQSFEERNKILQTRSVSIDIAAANIKALTEEMQSLREKWPSLLSEATVVANNLEIPTELMNTQQLRQTRTRKEDAQQKFKVNVFLFTLDTIISDLHQRFQSMEDVCKLFAPVLKLRKLSDEELITFSRKLISAYPHDFTDTLLGELQHLHKVYEATFSEELQPLDLLNAIYNLQLQGIFGEICIALRIFTTLPLSVAEGERAFSKLSLIKNYQRSTMSEQRLNSLAVISIENELAKKLDFKDLIKDFANRKVRRLTL